MKLDTSGFMVALELRNLGDKYRDAGDLKRAIPLCEANLAYWERLARKHPETPISRNDLADAYVAAGDLSRAIALYEINITDFEQEAGPDHLLILATRNGLAVAYLLAGNPARRRLRPSRLAVLQA